MFNGAPQKDFPLLANSDVAFLDNAASTQKPRVVIDAITNFYSTSNANVHRGLYDLSEKATAMYEAVRDSTQAFINAKQREEIIFTSGTTASLNLVANSLGELVLKKGSVILLSPTEHHSNLVPWQIIAERYDAELRWFDLNDDGSLNLDALADKFDDSVAIVSIGHISNASGIVHPIETIIELAHQYDIPVIVDAAQSAPHQVIDVQKLDCDFLAFSAHKMMGPTGVGILYGKREWLDKMPPWQGGGDMIREVTCQQSTWAELPSKFEAGTPNIAGVVGFGAALEYLQGIGIDTLNIYVEELYEYLLKQLQSVGGLSVLGPSDMQQRSSIASFTLQGIHPHDIAHILNDNNVAIRAGHHCAQPLMQHWNVSATARASIYVYNTQEDVDRLVIGLEKVKETFK